MNTYRVGLELRVCSDVYCCEHCQNPEPARLAFILRCIVAENAQGRSSADCLCVNCGETPSYSLACHEPEKKASKPRRKKSK